MSSQFQSVRKRSGEIVDFDQIRITSAVLKAMKSAEEGDRESAERVSEKVVKELTKKYSSRHILDIEEIQDIVCLVLKELGFENVANAYTEYRMKRQEIRDAKWWLLNHEVKTKLTPNALHVLGSRYLRKDENGKLIETPQQLFQRVARNVAAAEKMYNQNISDDELFRIEEKFFRMMASLSFLPNSPTLMNAGNVLQQLSACFVLPVPDSMEGIFQTIKETALIHQSGGGTGYSFSRLRPKGDMVRSTQGVASGPLSFMTVFDAATNTVKQGGKRRGAMMGILRVDHPDIVEFVTAKAEEGILSNFNISVALTNEFMESVKKEKKYNLTNPRNNQVWGEQEARKIFDLIVHHAWLNGEPGVIFIDAINNNNPTPSLGKIESTNPCGEQPLLPYESCNLGSINLAKMIKQKGEKWEVDWTKLKQIVHVAVHFLDNVIDVNRYQIPEIEEMTKCNRKIGLGIMGWADMLVYLEIPYNSKKALGLAEKIMKYIQNESKKASATLAEKRGGFPNFNDSVYNTQKLKVRNATTTTIAPTGTISIVAGASFGIEPYYAISFVRKHILGSDTELLDINPIFEEIAKKEGFYGKELMEEIAEKGTLQDINSVPSKWKKIFVTAQDISPEWHVKMQAAFQKYTDNAVSKTINFPYTAAEDDVRKTYLLAYELGCKGITIYRNNSRVKQVLNIQGVKRKETAAEKKRNKTKRKHEEKFVAEEISPELRDPSPELIDLPPGNCSTCHI